MTASEQLLLPIETRTKTVEWYHAERAGRSIVARLVDRAHVVANPITSWGLERRIIDTEAIDTLQDPALRYALRLSAAAESAGWWRHPGHSSSDSVTIYATDGGVDSELLQAVYTGTVKNGVDAFMENLRRYAPDHYEDH